ncbi:ABC transporter substrate-binding protein [Geomesophilobacter sediminis]|uniref:Aliphatic sulfonate ABC transporter substrate-binding protein n=1 Tax=Geomesophilobacter sediminis TaxID=2798584 RepID=A0A8J7JB98_9BACT|nr:aliphatic sulfonate ABC transporter substrate-binding protein [Geomesophilobacter sediminis]MBJ6724371.1 aliphatic sulfonate ABC transporter substrate-binding protein [Geomesophilobacter sediminis]
MKKVIAAAIALGALVIAAVAGAAEPAKEVRIGYQASSTIILLAKSKGFYDEEFAKEGVKVKYNLFLAGPPMIEALSGGRLDLVQTGDMPPVAGRAAGIDLKVIANSGIDPAHNALLVGARSFVDSVPELKGKKVGVPVGSSGHHFLFLLLAKHGLKPTDVHVVNLPATELSKALETGNIDAAAVWEPITGNIVHSGVGRVLADSTNIKRSVNVYLARNEFARANPKLVEAFLRGTKRAVDYFRKHPKAAQEAIAAESKYPLPVIAKITRRYDWSLAITNQDVAALEQVKNFLRENKVLRKEFAINDLFDLSYLKRSGLK